MKKILLILLTALAFNCFGQKIPYSIVNGAVKIQGVDGTNPVIYDNDIAHDTPEFFYIWLKANRKEINLVGNINTRNLHPGAMNESHDHTFNTWVKFYNAYVANGMKNLPAPIKGSGRNFNPSSIESSPGSELIISEAKKASPQKPLVIFVGGQVTSVANAFAKDRSIGPNIIVFQVDGFGETMHNATDDKACLELINGGVKYINWSGNLYSWYNKAGSPMYSGSNKMPGINLNAMPANSFSNELRNNWFNQSFAEWGDVGDGPPIFWFFNNNLWQNVARKTKSNQTVTGENYDYLLVSQNKWSDYGPMLNSYVVNPTNYIPVTGTIPPVEPPVEPPVQTQTPYKTLTIPGKIEAEDYDNGGEGIAYHDTDVTNNGGKYRTNGVDIEGNFNIGWVFDGEWLEYTTSVTAGSYKIEFRVASQTVGGSRFELKLDGVSIGTINTPLTGGSQNYQTVSFNANVTGGAKVLRLDVIKGQTNIDFIQFTPVGVEPPVNTPPIISILTSNTTYPAGSSIIITATASDDKSVSKVEFFNGSTKLGESLVSPYSWVINNATAGTYNLTGKATDNEGASTASSVRVVTVTGVVIPPLPGSNLNTYNVLSYGATGLGGNTDDRAAIQAAIDATIRTSGKLIIPSPINYYRTNGTLFIKPVAPESQAYISIEGNGKYWSQIVYQGPSNQPAVVIVGLKAGSSIKGMAVKLGDGVNNSACYDIGTSTLSTSTSGFSFENCSAELNQGINNQGWRIGKIDENRGSDISQIDWRNVTVFGPFKIIPGQVGFNFAGHNSLGFQITSGGAVFCETGIKVTAGGVISFVGYLTSQNGTELYMTHSTQVSFTGGRFESSQKFLRVDPSLNFTGINITGALISDFKTQNMFDFQGNGGLMLDNVKIESPFDFGPSMFTLGGGIGALSIRGGAINANDNFITPGGWRVKVENVAKLNSNYQSIGFLPNK